jgi:hypothetical protein
MKPRNIIAVCVSAAFVLFATVSFAEMIYLKDGRVINEKIVERGSQYIITTTGKKSNKYYMIQIDRIEDEEAEDYPSIDLSQFEDIPEGKVRLIIDYIDVGGVRSAMKQNIKQVIDQAPDEQKEKYSELFNVDEIIERLIPIYSKYYSEGDLVNMINFYDSPTGQNILESTPEIMKETVGVSIQYIKEKATP